MHLLRRLCSCSSAQSPTRALEAEYDGAYAIFPADRGIVLVELIGGGQARVTLALTGLAPNADYSLLWSKARCGRSSSASKTVLELDLTTNGAGAAYRAEVVPWLWAAVAPVPQSARLARDGASGQSCARANAFGDANGDESVSGTDYALFNNGTRRGLVVLERLGDTTGHLSWSLSGLKPGKSYRLMATTAGCAGTPNMANRLFSINFVAPATGIHAEKNQDVEVENDETHLGRPRLPCTANGRQRVGLPRRVGDRPDHRSSRDLKGTL